MPKTDLVAKNRQLLQDEKKVKNEIVKTIDAFGHQGFSVLDRIITTLETTPIDETLTAQVILYIYNEGRDQGKEELKYQIANM